MNKFESIRIERDGHAAHLQLNRPERINALGKAMLLEIQAAMDALEADAEVRVIVLSGADPLNLVGVVTSDERIAAAASTRIAFRDGAPAAVMEGDYVRPLCDMGPEAGAAVASVLAGRPLRGVTSGFVGRAAVR